MNGIREERREDRAEDWNPPKDLVNIVDFCGFFGVIISDVLNNRYTCK